MGKTARLYYCTRGNYIPNMEWYCLMTLTRTLNASHGFVSISWASYCYVVRIAYCANCYGNVSVCLSVYHTPVIVSNRYVKPILKLSRPSGSPIIQFFFLTAVPISNSKVTHSAGAKNTPEVGKIGDFRRKSPRLSRKRCEIGRFLLWNVNRKSLVPDRMVSFSMTLSVP